MYALDQMVVVNTCQRFEHQRYLRMDATTFQALQVLKEERHPNVLGAKGRWGLYVTSVWVCEQACVL